MKDSVKRLKRFCKFEELKSVINKKKIHKLPTMNRSSVYPLITSLHRIHTKRKLQPHKRLQPEILYWVIYTLALIKRLTQKYHSAEYTRLHLPYAH